MSKSQEKRLDRIAQSKGFLEREREFGTRDARGNSRSLDYIHNCEASVVRTLTYFL
jgi:hypothetical protein